MRVEVLRRADEGQREDAGGCRDEAGAGAGAGSMIWEEEQTASYGASRIG